MFVCSVFSSEEVDASTSQVKDHTNNANNVCVWHKKVFNTKWVFKNYNLQALKPKGKNPIHGMNPLIRFPIKWMANSGVMARYAFVMSWGDMRCLYSGGGFISNVWILVKRVGGDRR